MVLAETSTLAFSGAKMSVANPGRNVCCQNVCGRNVLHSILQNKVWPDYNRNRQSVGELWLGLFRYYLEEFDVAEQVVTVRQQETLTKFEKLWNGKCIAIEGKT